MLFHYSYPNTSFSLSLLLVIVSVQMVNDTEAGLRQDYERIRSLEDNGLFELL